MSFRLRTLFIAMTLLAGAIWMAFHGPARRPPLNIFDGLARTAMYFAMFAAFAVYARHEVRSVWSNAERRRSDP